MRHRRTTVPLLCLGLLAISLLGGPAGDTFAQEGATERSSKAVFSLPFIKLGRGLVNVGTGVFELPLQIYRTGTHDGWIAGTFLGPINGLGMFIARTIGGAYEILTFPFPLPLYYQPMFEPEFLWSTDPAMLQESVTLIPGE